MDRLYSFYTLRNFNLTKLDGSLIFPKTAFEDFELIVILEVKTQTKFSLKIEEISQKLKNFNQISALVTKLPNFSREKFKTYRYCHDLQFEDEILLTIGKIGEIITEFIEGAKALLTIDIFMSLSCSDMDFPKENKVIYINQEKFMRIIDNIKFTYFQDFYLLVHYGEESYQIDVFYPGDLITSNCSGNCDIYWRSVTNHNSIEFKTALKLIAIDLFNSLPNSLSSGHVNSLRSSSSSSLNKTS